MTEDPPPARTTRVAIELQAGEPIQGSLSPETGGTHRFVGWIELANALDALRLEAPNDELEARIAALEADGE